MKIPSFVGIIGIILVITGILLAVIFRIIPWYLYFAPGVIFILVWCNARVGANHLFDRLEKNYKRELIIFLLYLGTACAIELCGNNVFHFWTYPDLLPSPITFSYIILTYIFAFYLLYELYTFLSKILKNQPAAFIITFILAGFIQEYLNTFVYEWKYTLTFLKDPLMLLGIPVIMLLGWTVFIVAPIVAHSFVYHVRLGFEIPKKKLRPFFQTSRYVARRPAKLKTVAS